ncbi:hypothetical protein CLF_105682 [Clonorchis sinensis]|uniref:Uncharacterized protein n=1 Tax=Clonorchis sinensis TaxID=79923 RepID=G7YDZ4_CLOSI|nr:hypothetical protein CLF_105682 [Clonorchis sinensis]
MALQATSARHLVPKSLDFSKSFFKHRCPFYLSALILCTLKHVEQHNALARTPDSPGIDMCCVAKARIQDVSTVVEPVTPSLFTLFRQRTSGGILDSVWIDTETRSLALCKKPEVLLVARHHQAYPNTRNQGKHRHFSNLGEISRLVSKLLDATNYRTSSKSASELFVRMTYRPLCSEVGVESSVSACRICLPVFGKKTAHKNRTESAIVTIIKSVGSPCESTVNSGHFLLCSDYLNTNRPGTKLRATQMASELAAHYTNSAPGSPCSCNTYATHLPNSLCLSDACQFTKKDQEIRFLESRSWDESFPLAKSKTFFFCGQSIVPSSACFHTGFPCFRFSFIKSNLRYQSGLVRCYYLSLPSNFCNRRCSNGDTTGSPQVQFKPYI